MGVQVFNHLRHFTHMGAHVFNHLRHFTHMGVHVFNHLRHFTNYILLMQTHHYQIIYLQDAVDAKVNIFFKH
jgi:hypothetical protein